MKNKIKFFLLLLFILIFNGCSNLKTDKEIVESVNSNKFVISIGEDFFNSFLNQIGEIKGEQKVKMSKILKFIKIDKDINWTLSEMKIDIEDNGAVLYGKAIIDSNGEIIESGFKAKIELNYNNEEEKLSFVPVEMQIKKLANIDITNFYTPIFEIKVSNPFNKDVKLKMPDGNLKNISIKTEALIETKKDRIEIIMSY